MKYFFLLLLITSTAIAQSSYSSADQNTQNNDEGSQNDTGYVNKDLENDDVEFSAEMDGTAPMPQNQEEPKELSSGKNATPRPSKRPIDD
jgi:hypothetical protein